MEERVHNGDTLIINGPELVNAERRIVCSQGRYYVLQDNKNIIMDISDSGGGGFETPQEIVEAYKRMGMKVELKNKKKKGPAVASGSIQVPTWDYTETEKKKTGITQVGQMNIIELGDCKPSGIISDDGYNDAKQLIGYIPPSSVAKEAVPMITAKHAKILKEKLEKYGANGVDELQVYAQLVKIVDFYERQSFFMIAEKAPTMYFGQDWNKGQDATMTAIQCTVNGDQEEPKPETAITPNLSATEKAAMAKFKEATKEKYMEDIARLVANVNHAYGNVTRNYQRDWDHLSDEKRKKIRNDIKAYMERGKSFEHIHSHWVTERAQEGWVFGELFDLQKKQTPYLVPYNQLPQEKRAIDAIIAAICDFFK
ncbi:RyR domain-containing protein [Priestia megaterium]|uniref:RyR domain-containing protein n=1 Tax=Priestia megaterium TaxID=1404 RepID=UPI003D07D228